MSRATNAPPVCEQLAANDLLPVAAHPSLPPGAACHTSPPPRVRPREWAGGSAVVLAPPRPVLAFAPRSSQGPVGGFWRPCLRAGRQRRGRRARAGFGAQLGAGCVGAGRSRSRSGLGDRERDDLRLGQPVRVALGSEVTEADGVFEAERLQWLGALRAGNQVRPRGGGEPQPAVRAARECHEPETWVLAGRPWPHSGQARSITGSSERSSPSSK